MKIVIASESYWPAIDGGAVAEHALALGLAARGHEVHILAPSESWRSYDEKDNGTVIHRMRSFKLPLVKDKRDMRATMFPYFKIQLTMAKIKPDVVHIHNPFGIGWSALLAAEFLRVPVLATNHMLPENLLMFMAQWRGINATKLLRMLNWTYFCEFYNRADMVTSPTQTAVNILLENGLKVPAQPVSNGVDISVFKPDNDGRYLKEKFRIPDKPIVMYTGRISGEKCVDVLIRAFPLVREKIDAYLVVGGEGRERMALINLAKNLGLEDHSTFTGFLEEKDLPNLYTLASCYVMPSVAELQSIVGLEAMASGLPLVVADKYALPELVEVGENGYLFQPGDEKDLAARIVEVLQDDNKRKQMGAKSRQLVQKHSRDRVITDYFDLYQKIIDQRRAVKK